MKPSLPLASARSWGRPQTEISPRVGADQADDRLDRRRLAGAVGTEEAEDLAAANLEREARQHVDPPLEEPGIEALVEPVNAQRNLCHPLLHWPSAMKYIVRIAPASAPASASAPEIECKEPRGGPPPALVTAKSVPRPRPLLRPRPFLCPSPSPSPSPCLRLRLRNGRSTTSSVTGEWARGRSKRQIQRTPAGFGTGTEMGTGTGNPSAACARSLRLDGPSVR